MGVLGGHRYIWGGVRQGEIKNQKRVHGGCFKTIHQFQKLAVGSEEHLGCLGLLLGQDLDCRLALFRISCYWNDVLSEVQECFVIVLVIREGLSA